MSRLIHKKWLPLKDIEARDLKFYMGPYFTQTHAVQKERHNLRPSWKISTDYWRMAIGDCYKIVPYG